MKKKQKKSKIFKKRGCPFYGFVFINGNLFEEGKYTCALLSQGCILEENGFRPFFSICPYFYSDAGREKFIEKCQSENVRVFAEAFRPKNDPEWEGIPFQEWKEKYS